MFLPLLLILMLSGIQLITYVNAARKVELVATSISEMVSQAVPPQGSPTATVNTTDIKFSRDSALVIFPFLMQDAKAQNITWDNDISINYASVQFTQLLTTCSAQGDQSSCYGASVVWTSSGLGGGNRQCIIPQLPADDTAAPNRLNLPRSVYGPGSIIVIDVVFTFKPSFGSGFVPSVRIARSVYVQPRYATLINFDTTSSDGTVTKCLGY